MEYFKTFPWKMLQDIPRGFQGTLQLFPAPSAFYRILWKAGVVNFSWLMEGPKAQTSCVLRQWCQQVLLPWVAGLHKWHEKGAVRLVHREILCFYWNASLMCCTTQVLSIVLREKKYWKLSFILGSRLIHVSNFSKDYLPCVCLWVHMCVCLRTYLRKGLVIRGPLSGVSSGLPSTSLQ